MTRIAYVLTQDRGGPVDMTLTLAETMLQSGEFDVRVFGPPPAKGHRLLEQNFTCMAVDRKEDLAGIWRMRSMLRSWRPDVVHAHDRRAGLAVTDLGLLRCGPRAVVHTYHGVPYDVGEQWFRGEKGARPPSFYSRAILAGDAAIAARMTRTVVPSTSMVDFLRSRLRVPRRRLVHIDNGVELPDVTPVRGPVRRLLFIGNLYPVKGLMDLLDALSKPGVMPGDATLDVAGDGPERLKAETLACQPPLAGRVRFLGFRADVAELLQHHDALVLSSRIEQQPLVVAQAMGAGRPVLATRVGDVPKMLEISGAPRYLAPPGDVEALAAELVQLFANPNPAALGRELAIRARIRYAPATCAAAHAKLYESLLC